MTHPGDDEDRDESTDERPVTMRSVKRTEEEPGNEDDDREQWLRENVPPHHI
jgi:hypothetical protein